MAPRRFINLSIPTDWTSQQALAVIDFLEEICRAIWSLHEELITEAHIQQDLRDCVACEEDDIPF